jgi:hypothetical protein
VSFKPNCRRRWWLLGVSGCPAFAAGKTLATGHHDPLRTVAPAHIIAHEVGLLHSRQVLDRFAYKREISLPLDTILMKLLTLVTLGAFRYIVKTWGCVVKVSASGDVVGVLMDSKGAQVSSVSAVTEFDGKLFLGNLMGDYVSVLSLADVAIAGSSDSFEDGPLREPVLDTVAHELSP